ncbi:large exoprotein [Microbacterium sp. P06]|uniref:large exoprotein n=1 Tax=Microbacterium sp. P06 TaxID=3366949 RepID=UPI0037459567
MGGQVWGGGVIVAVAVVLWLVYLLPSWHSRHQYTSAERNAVRLNQAIRVLAETSETPQEVRLELSARSALAQQKLARRAQEQNAQAELAIARARLDVEREQSAAEREAARAELAAAREIARARHAASRALPAARRARARRMFRLTTTSVAFVALAVTGVGIWQAAIGASAALVWVGSLVTAMCVLALHRISRVAARSVEIPVAAPVARAAGAVQDVSLEIARAAAWTPRELPRPLVSSAGSRAAAVLDEQAAREALRAAAREEAQRTIAAQQAPPSIETARVARRSEFSRMGYVDDAEIEAHVRHLLERRASGQ